MTQPNRYRLEVRVGMHAVLGLVEAPELVLLADP
jgi:hypothetical protein